MTEITKFKVGDKVRYKESEKKNAKYNGHDPNEIYTVKNVDPVGCVWFVGEDYFCSDHRLELAPGFQEETFDYKQALKILAENPDLPLQRTSDNGQSWFDIHTYDADGIKVYGVHISFNEHHKYRLKVIPKPTFHWLIKSKGKFAVTSQKYTSEEDVKAGYSYPVEVIQKLED